MTETIVLGLGNLVHRDDGVGVHAIQALQVDERVPPGIVLIDGGTQGLSLLPHISGAKRLLVLDAVDAGEKPGTVMVFAGNTLKGIPGKASVHQLGFSDLMIAIELLGSAPEEVVVIGVQPDSTDWGIELTDSVAKSLPGMVDCVVAQLSNWKEHLE